jgi:hypothetical protein
MRYAITIVLLSALLGLSVSGCATSTVFLTDRDKVYIVPANRDIPVIWADEETVIRTDKDMVLLDKGTYLRLEKEADANLINP